MSDRFTKTDLEKAKEATKRIKNKKAQKRMKNSRPEKKGSSITDIFKSYGKYDGKPIELKGGGLSAGQKKIASKAPPYDEIGGNDFAVLKKEKAKGRGMGLQDEKVKPGKVKKAALGMLALGIGAKKLMDKKGKGLPPGLGAAGIIAKKKKDILGMGGGMMQKPGGAVLMPQDRRNQKIGLMPQDRKIQTTRPILRARDKKMGGGMVGSMQKPMGYSKGRSVKVKCKLGRNKPTKMY